jgi:hypothetical protein
VGRCKKSKRHRSNDAEQCIFWAGSLICDGQDQTVAFKLRKAVSTSLLAFIAFSSSASSGRKSEPNYPAHFPFAYVQEGCGPADGPALLFYFTVKSAKCGKYEEPFLLIQIIGNLPKSAPHAYTTGSGSRDMLASRCQSPGHCEAATSGVLHLTKFSQSKNASGEYELHFRDGSIEKGSFNATWCLLNLICR